MDYEKAYKEALERARKIHSEIVNNELLGFPGQIEDIFPELRESEDERIRKGLIEALKTSKTVGELKHILPEPTREECIAYLEKQKINTEGDFGRGYDCGYEACLNSHGAEWFEKQKENPKSADSIPSDCTSDAKCEDRSPKHSDSDGTDIRDTPAYWRGWDDAMKQKEQKPISSYDIVPYIDDKIAELQDMWREEKVSFDWDDMKDMIEDVARHFYQKEQIPYTDFVIEPHEGDDNNPYDMGVPEAHEYAIKRGFDIPFDHGEVYVDERHLTQTIGNILRWADEHPKEQKGQKFISCDSIGAAILSALASGIDTDDILKARGFTYEDVEKYLISVEQKEQNLIMANSPQLKEQKPAEWDDKDEKVYDYLKGGFEYATNNPNLLNSLLSGASDATIQDYRNFIDKLKTLRPQPKQEWSEVELEFRGEKVKVKRPFFRDGNGRGYSTTEQDDDVVWYALRAWAESHGYTTFDLYPRAEWSEEDEEMRDNIICILHKDVTYMPPTGLNSCAGSGNAFYTHQTEIDWLKSLRPSWKPTEEQMDSLRDTIVQTKGYSYSMYLPELYEQLKKLM